MKGFRSHIHGSGNSSLQLFVHKFLLFISTDLGPWMRINGEPRSPLRSIPTSRYKFGFKLIGSAPLKADAIRRPSSRGVGATACARLFLLSPGSLLAYRRPRPGPAL